MTVSILRPSSTSSNTGTVTGAGGVAHTALSDDSDSSYLVLDGLVGATPGESWIGGLGDLTLPAGAVIKQIRARGRLSLDSVPGTPGYVYYVLTVGSNSLYQALFLNNPSGQPETFTFGTWTPSVTDSDVDAATLVIGASTSDATFRAYEAYVDVTYVEKPVVSADLPLGTLTTTNLPLVEWSATLDSDGGPVEVFEVKVYNDAEYGAGGFDPYTSTPTATSGISSAATSGAPATSWQLDETLPDDTYLAYVRIAQIVNGNYHWSDWDAVGFVVDVDPPAAPDLTSIIDSANARVQLSVFANAGTASTDILELERSLDGSAWEHVRTLDGTSGLLAVPYVVATGTYSDSSDGTSHSLALPAPVGGILTDDLLVAFVAMDGNPTLTWPAGWTEIKDEAGNGSAVRVGAAWKRADGGEAGTFTLTTSASEGGGARVLCIRNAHPSTAPQVSTGVSGSGANANPDTLTPTWSTENTLWIAAVGNDGNVAVTAGPSGYYGFGNTRWANASGAGISTAYLANPTGSDDPGAFTHTAEDTRAFTVAVRPRVPSLIVYDYEGPNGTTVQYRARALHDYSGEYVASDWDTDSDAWTSASWWLKHPNQPDLNVAVTVRGISPVARAGRQGVFQALGATTAMVVADTRSPGAGQIILRALTFAAQDALDALLDETATLLLQGPADSGEPGYIRVLGHERARIVEGRQDASDVWETLEYVQVTSPPGAVVEWP